MKILTKTFFPKMSENWPQKWKSWPKPFFKNVHKQKRGKCYNSTKKPPKWILIFKLTPKVKILMKIIIWSHKEKFRECSQFKWTPPKKWGGLRKFWPQKGGSLKILREKRGVFQNFWRPPPFLGGVHLNCEQDAYGI